MLLPIKKVTLSVAVQQNKELEKQQAAIQQVTISVILAAFDVGRLSITQPFRIFALLYVHKQQCIML